MRNLSLALAALLMSGSFAAAQNSTNPRLDGEGINLDAGAPTHGPAAPSGRRVCTEHIESSEP
jgi:hypothetical protein